MELEWVFLDRDGTLNVRPRQHHYITDPDDLVLLPAAGDAVRRLNRAGIWVGIVTNQRGVARGQLTEARLADIHDRLRVLLAEQNAHVDGIWFCPHADLSCGCRKPGPGLLLQAKQSVPAIDFTKAAIVGDSDSDVAAGRALGLTTVRLGASGDGATFCARDVGAAVDLLLSKTVPGRSGMDTAAVVSDRD